MMGPIETWQTADKNFPQIGELTVGSKNLGEEYRINTPVISYGFDSTFLDYFGAAGVRAVDQAMGMLNALPAVSQATPGLVEFPLEATGINFQAQTLGVLDMKSQALGFMVEHLGLLGETHVFDLRLRNALTGGGFSYVTVIRNFDPVTLLPSKYVNGVLYTFEIQEFAGGNVGDAVERPVDPAAITMTAVASFKTGAGGGPGGYFTSLTRDDFGGLRYMYRANNFNTETLPAGSSVVSSSPWSIISGTSTNLVVTNAFFLSGGVEKITFVKLKFDSLLGAGFIGFTNSFSSQVITNSRVTIQRVQRIVTQPDVVFAAADVTGTGPGVFSALRSDPIFSGVPASLVGGQVRAGPGTIAPGPKVVTFNTVGPFAFNSTPSFLDESTSFSGFVWGSFDGSTNDPVIFPSGTSIRQLESQVLSAP